MYLISAPNQPAMHSQNQKNGSRPSTWHHPKQALQDWPPAATHQSHTCHPPRSPWLTGHPPLLAPLLPLQQALLWRSRWQTCRREVRERQSTECEWSQWSKMLWNDHEHHVQYVHDACLHLIHALISYTVSNKYNLKHLKHWWSDWHDSVPCTSGVPWGTHCTGPCRTCLYHGTVWLFCNWCITNTHFISFP